MNPRIALKECSLFREYQSQLKLTQSLLERLQEKKDKLAQPATVFYTDEPKVRSVETSHTRMVNLLTEERILKNYQCQYASKMEAVLLLIDDLPDEISQMLKMKYVHGHEWEVLERKFGYTRKWMDRMIRMEIQKLDYEMI